MDPRTTRTSSRCTTASSTRLAPGVARLVFAVAAGGEGVGNATRARLAREAARFGDELVLPDVAQRYRRYKDAGRAAWSFSVDRSTLGGLGHGVLRIRVRVRARTGRTTPIGRLTLAFR